jgi:hypothetical protein
MPFMYSLYKMSDLSELGNALAGSEVEALHQIRDYRSKHGKADLRFQLSDDPADYLMEKQNAIPSPRGIGWTNDPRGMKQLVYVRSDVLQK